MANDPENDYRHSVPRDLGTPPYWDDEPRSGRRTLWWVLFAIFLAGIAGGYIFWDQIRGRPTPAPQAPGTQPSAAPTLSTPPPPSEEAPAKHPIVTPPPPSAQAPAERGEPLPPLKDSDQQFRESLAGLAGADPVAKYLQPEHIITRIVATVDALPRHQAPERVRPVKSVASPFQVERSGEKITIAASNGARYEPYVAIFDALPANNLVAVYEYFYPLFQKAYENLGYPNRYFNDRVFETIDDLLAAPEPHGPIALTQPKVLYEFADPDLEGLSAGQKIMIRMGRENEAKVKKKLRAIRSALTKR